MTSRLIFDIGMHRGEDTDFYLKKGFRVVAVEANPSLCQNARQRFAGYLQSEQLAIVNVGLWDTTGAMTFYRNLDNDDWSSFHRDAGTREGTRYEEMQIECVTIAMLLSRYGVPYYMKIDVEGADKIILNDIAQLEARPRFISAEEYGIGVIKDLRRLGYDRFQIVAQAAKCRSAPPFPSREGK
jgi:FkbM family methyltransferase